MAEINDSLIVLIAQQRRFRRQADGHEQRSLARKHGLRLALPMQQCSRENRKPMEDKETAGDGIRTHDVQLGKIHGQTVKTAWKPRAIQQVSDGKYFSQGFARYRVFSRLIGVFP
ncbi:MAG: hypothetical protein HZA51_03545 [Planctomycetes bacterium]|nr:hypothetical protein [Planctomycetota bacterium]